MSRVNIVAILVVLLLALVGLFLALRPGTPDSEASTEGPVETLYDVDIQEGAMVPNELTVEEGEQVVLRLLSDDPIEFHLHGYEIEQELESGEPTEVAFEADITGRFEIEDHNTEAALGELLVQPR